MAAPDNQAHVLDVEAMHAAETARRERKELYFFYGSLMDPKAIQNMLETKNPLDLQSATVIGHAIKMLGKYPVLLERYPGEIVHGKVCEVQGEEHKR